MRFSPSAFPLPTPVTLPQFSSYRLGVADQHAKSIPTLSRSQLIFLNVPSINSLRIRRRRTILEHTTDRVQGGLQLKADLRRMS